MNNQPAEAAGRQNLLAGLGEIHARLSQALSGKAVTDDDVRRELAALRDGIAALAQDAQAPAQPESARHLEICKVRVSAMYEEGRISERALIEFAQIALRGVLLVNGGALVAMLTFVGNFPQQAVAQQLWAAFAWFVLGLSASLAASFFAFLAQIVVRDRKLATADRIYFGEIQGQHSLASHMGAEESVLEARAKWLRVVTIACAVASLLGFVMGALFGILAVVG